MVGVNETYQESVPPVEEAVAPVRSNPARANTSRARRSASTWVGRPGTVVVVGQAGGGLAGGVGGLIPELLADPGEATAHPDEADPPPVEDSVHGRPPARCTWRLRSAPATLQPEASSSTEPVRPNASAKRATRAEVVVASAR
jgi:hypothetical protein